MENDIIDALNDIGYEGPLLEGEIFQKALEDGIKSLDFTKLIHTLATEIKQLCDLEESVSIINDPSESSSFLLELSSFLKEMGCPYKSLVTGHMSSRLQSKDDRLLLLDYLVSELMAARIVKIRKPKDANSSMDIVVQESPTAKNLKDILIKLKFNKPPPKITPEVLFNKLEPKLKETIQKEGANLFGKPLYNKAISEKEWKDLDMVFADMLEEYSLRREMLITRLDCTIQSFEWSDRLKSKRDEIQAAYRPKRDQLKVKPDVRLSDLLAARTSLLQLEKTSSAAVRKNTRSDINKVIIGQVPDRGGRPNEQQPPPPEMPSWTQRSATGDGGGRGGRGRGGDRGGRGGRVQGGYSQGGGHGPQTSPAAFNNQSQRSYQTYDVPDTRYGGGGGYNQSGGYNNQSGGYDNRQGYNGGQSQGPQTVEDLTQDVDITEGGFCIINAEYNELYNQTLMDTVKVKKELELSALLEIKKELNASPVDTSKVKEEKCQTLTDAIKVKKKRKAVKDNDVKKINDLPKGRRKNRFKKLKLLNIDPEYALSLSKLSLPQVLAKDLLIKHNIGETKISYEDMACTSYDCLVPPLTNQIHQDNSSLIAAQFEEILSKQHDREIRREYASQMRIGIIDTTQPMTAVQMNMLGIYLLRAVKRTIHNKKNKPKLLISGFFQMPSGWVLVSCLNSFSYAWLKKMKNHLKSWSFAKLILVPPGELLPPPPCAYVTVNYFYQRIEIDKVLELIELYNGGVYPFLWKVMSVTLYDQSTKFQCLIDDASAKTIEANNYRLECGQCEIYFEIMRKPDYHPTLRLMKQENPGFKENKKNSNENERAPDFRKSNQDGETSMNTVHVKEEPELSAVAEVSNALENKVKIERATDQTLTIAIKVENQQREVIIKGTNELLKDHTETNLQPSRSSLKAIARNTKKLLKRLSLLDIDPKYAMTLSKMTLEEILENDLLVKNPDNARMSDKNKAKQMYQNSTDLIAAQFEAIICKETNPHRKNCGSATQLRYGIIDVSKPMTSVQINLLGIYLLEAMINTNNMPGVKKRNKILISGFFPKPSGWVSVSCSSRQSLFWLGKTIYQLHPWPNAKLAIASLLPQLPHAIATVNTITRQINLEPILKMIKSHYRGVYPFSWEILSFTYGESIKFKCLLDEASAKTIAANNNMLDCGPYQIIFEITRQPEFYPTLSAIKQQKLENRLNRKGKQKTLKTECAHNLGNQERIPGTSSQTGLSYHSTSTKPFPNLDMHHKTNVSRNNVLPSIDSHETPLTKNDIPVSIVSLKRKINANEGLEPKKIKTDESKPKIIENIFAKYKILFAVLPESYPLDEMKMKHVDILHNLIVQALLSAPDPLPKIIVERKVENGIGYLRCADFESAVWAMENLNGVFLDRLKIRIRKILEDSNKTSKK